LKEEEREKGRRNKYIYPHPHECRKGGKATLRLAILIFDWKKTGGEKPKAVSSLSREGEKGKERESLIHKNPPETFALLGERRR